MPKKNNDALFAAHDRADRRIPHLPTTREGLYHDELEKLLEAREKRKRQNWTVYPYRYLLASNPQP